MNSQFLISFFQPEELASLSEGFFIYCHYLHVLICWKSQSYSQLQVKHDGIIIVHAKEKIDSFPERVSCM